MAFFDAAFLVEATIMYLAHMIRLGFAYSEKGAMVSLEFAHWALFIAENFPKGWLRQIAGTFLDNNRTHFA